MSHPASLGKAPYHLIFLQMYEYTIIMYRKISPSPFNNSYTKLNQGHAGDDYVRCQSTLLRYSQFSQNLHEIFFVLFIYRHPPFVWGAP